MDAIDNHEEEDTLDQANRMLDDGESAQGKVDAIYRARDQYGHAYQSFAEHDGGNQALDHLALWDFGVKDGAS